jgi:NADPH:quinone reductase-like Zn-dependent oxidoreductase
MAQLLQMLLLGPFLSRFGNQKMRGMMTNANSKDLVFLKELLEAGKIVPAIDRSYPLGDVASAIRYLMEGHSRGKVVITMTAHIREISR